MLDNFKSLGRASMTLNLFQNLRNYFVSSWQRYENLCRFITSDEIVFLGIEYWLMYMKIISI